MKTRREAAGPGGCPVEEISSYHQTLPRRRRRGADRQASADVIEAGGSNVLMNPAETPELNATTERKFRTLGERTLCMILRSGLPVDFWWDAYEASNYITNRLPTKTSCGYQTPYEGVFGEIPDLSLLRVWGCKACMKIPRRTYEKNGGRSVPLAI